MRSKSRAFAKSLPRKLFPLKLAGLSLEELEISCNRTISEHLSLGKFSTMFHV